LRKRNFREILEKISIMTSLESFRNEWRNEITGKKESDAIDLWLQVVLLNDK